jgi:Acetyltransferase (GNAT) family
MLQLPIYDGLRIRLGTLTDLKEVMELAIAAAKENSLFDCSATHLLRTVYPCLNLDKGMVGCIGKQDGEIEGMVVLVIGTLSYTDAPCLEERTLYVKPAYRNAKGGRASKLVQFSKSAAERLQLPLLIGVLSNAHTEQKIELYKRVLGEPAGAFWVLGAKTGGHEVTP